MASPVEVPIYMRIGDNPEQLIGTIAANNTTSGGLGLADFLREVADYIEIIDNKGYEEDTA